MNKKIILFIVCTCIFTLSYGQIPVANGYISNDYINKYEGEWLWISGTNSVRIKLKKMPVKLIKPVNSYREILLGCHEYISNGVIIESSMDKYDSLVNLGIEKLATVYVYHVEGKDTSIVTGNFNDLTKNKGLDVSFEFINSIPQKIRMILKTDPGIKYTFPNDPNPYIPGITLPVDILLTKQ